jgi:HEAT repeat protein
MLKAVKENDSISNLARNPLMIAIIAIIYEEDRELPQRRAALYQRAVEVLLSKWDIRKKMENKFSPEKKEFILRKLALENHCQNRRTMSEAAILEMIEQYAPQVQLEKQDAEPLLKEIWQRSYLLRQIAMGTYDFLHLSFQEYFTALELTKQPEGIGTIITHIDKPLWEEPIRLYAGITQDAGPLIKQIQNGVPEDIFYSNIMLAGQCIVDAEFPEPDLKEEIIQKLWSLYNDSEFELLRKRALEVLALVRPRRIIDYLIQQLNDENSVVRGRASKALGAIGSIEAIPVLIQTLQWDKDSLVRGDAAYALGTIGSQEVITTLIQEMKTDIDYIRLRTAEALAVIGSPEAIPVLIQALESDKNSQVRNNAAYALGTLSNPEPIPVLIKALKTDKSSNVRGSAAKALGKIGKETTIQPLKKALNDNEKIVKNKAFEALEKISKRVGVRITRTTEDR